MRVVITGGAGFIGSHLAEHLLAQGHTVHLIDDLSTGRRANVESALGRLAGRCTLQVARLADLPDDGAWLDDADQVYHLAAAVGVKLIVDHPVHAIEDNVVDTAKVLHAAAQRKIPTLVASSSEVYGKSAKVPFAEDDDVLYGSTRYSRWSYAMTKALDEYLALAHYQTDGLPVVIVRLFNTVGPRQVGQYGMVVPRFIQNALANEPIEIYGTGRQTRCFCHVADIVTALPKLMAAPAARGEVFNLGSDEEVTIEQLARRVIDLSGSSSELKYVPYDQAYRTRFDDLQRRVPDLAKVRRVLGFAPTRTLDDILRELIQLHRDNPAARRTQHA